MSDYLTNEHFAKIFSAAGSIISAMIAVGAKLNMIKKKKQKKEIEMEERLKKIEDELTKIHLILARHDGEMKFIENGMQLAKE